MKTIKEKLSEIETLVEEIENHGKPSHEYYDIFSAPHQYLIDVKQSQHELELKKIKLFSLTNDLNKIAKREIS